MPMLKLKNYKPTHFMAKTSSYNKEMADCVFVLVSRIRNSNGSFAPHGLCLLHRHLECGNQGMLVASEVGAAFLDSYDSVQRAAEIFEPCNGFDEA